MTTSDSTPTPPQPVPASTLGAPAGEPNAVERIKAASHHLRGTLRESQGDELTLALRPDDTQLSKFHGFYQQDDRDQRAERQQQQLEPLHSFMLRVCIPGGVLQPAQWLALDRLAEQYGDGGLRATTRQAVQLHGVVRGALKPTIAAIDAVVLSTLAGCGDVNRNVMCTPVANSARLLEQLEATARRLSRALSPRTAAYRELWLDGKPAATAEAEPTPVPEALRSKSPEEPLYGDTYLPRKFRSALRYLRPMTWMSTPRILA